MLPWNSAKSVAPGSDADSDGRLAVLSDGSLVLAYTALSTSGDIYFQRYSETGQALGAATLVNAGGTIGAQSDGVVAATTDGGFVVGWIDTGGGNNIRLQRYSANGSTNGTVISIVGADADANFGFGILRIAALAGDAFAVSWYTIGGDDAFGAIVSGGNTVGTTLALDTDYAGGTHETTTVASNGIDRLIFAWTDFTAGSDVAAPGIRARIFNSSSVAQSVEFTVNQNGNSTQALPDAAFLSDGRFVITWSSADPAADGSGNSVWARIFNGDGTAYGNDLLVNTTISGNQFRTSVTALPDGGFAVGWLSQNDASFRMQVFDAIGGKRGGEYVVAFGVTTSVDAPSVRALADGRIAVAWREGNELWTQIVDPRDGTVNGDGSSNRLFGNTFLDDRIQGFAGGDTLFGLGGNDFLNGGSGNDRILGGDGDDIAVFRVTFAEATIVRMAHGSYIVADIGAGAEGFDLLRGVETLRFADRSIDVTGFAHDDLNGDGDSDVLVRSTSTGTLLRLDIADGFQSGGGLIGATGSANWLAQATGDLNRDGIADIVLKNTSTGQFYIWTVQNGQQTGGGDLGVIGATWDVVTTGDYNTDGIADLLWRNSANGDLYVWTMNASLGFVSSTHLGTLGTNWNAGPSGDLNGDGSSDVLLRNSNDGRLYAYLMSAGIKTSEIDFGSLGINWTIGGLGDFNGDTFSDIALRNTSTGQVYLYLMKAGRTWDGSDLGLVTGAGWQIAGTGDYDEDSTDDILWHNSVTGEAYLWTMAEGKNAAFASHSLGVLATDLAII